MQKKSKDLKGITTILLIFFVAMLFISARTYLHIRNNKSKISFENNLNKIVTEKKLNLKIKKRDNKFTTDKSKNIYVSGTPIYLRIIKEDSTLQLFMYVNKKQRFEHVRDFGIHIYQRNKGTKKNALSINSPEGFYYIKASDLKSQVSHKKKKSEVSLPLGKTNRLDKKLGFKANQLIKISQDENADENTYFTMSDEDIKELRKVIFSSFFGGQTLVKIHIFPFKMNPKTVSEKRSSPWYAFWQNMSEGYEHFERRGIPPNTWINQNKYKFANSQLP